MILPSLYIAQSPSRGRGVFTHCHLAPGITLETSPVIVLSSADHILLDQTLLHDYVFLWGKEETECCIALGYISIYNHDYKSNAEYEMDFDLSVIHIKTIRAIEAGEEIFINYNGNWNDPRPVWFEVSGVR